MRRALKLVSQGAVVSQPKQNVFNDRLNCPRLSHSLKLSGNVFHRRGPAAAKLCLWSKNYTATYELFPWLIRLSASENTPVPRNNVRFDDVTENK